MAIDNIPLTVTENTQEVTLEIDDTSHPYYVGARAYVTQTPEGAIVTVIDKFGKTEAVLLDGNQGRITDITYDPDTRTIKKVNGVVVSDLITLSDVAISNDYEDLDNLPDIDDIIEEWVDEHPSSTRDYVTPEMFGAAGDGVKDDTLAIQRCFLEGKYILMKPNATYLVSDTIHVGSGVTLNLNGATIMCTHRHLFYNFYSDDVFSGYNGNGNISIINGKIVGGGISFIHGSNILIDSVSFSNCVNNHYLEICACNHYTIRNCTFNGMSNVLTAGEYINLDPCYSSNFPWLDEQDAYDGTPNRNITVDKCVFSVGEDDYAYGAFAFGCHSNGAAGLQNHSIIKFTNNHIENMQDYGIRINCMDDVTVMGNVFKQTSYAIQMGSWEVCHNVEVCNNLFIYTGTGTGYVYLFRDAGVDGLAVCGNSYKVTGNSKINYRFNYDINQDTVINLIQTEKQMSQSNTNIIPPITAFNRIEIVTGAPSTGTYQPCVVASFYSRNFQVGELFPYLVNDAGTPKYETVTIVDAHTLSFSGAVRAVYLYKDNTIK